MPKNYHEAEAKMGLGDPNDLFKMAYCKNLDGEIDGKEGFLLTSFSQEKVRARGSTPFVDKSPKNLEAIEYQPIAGDHILGMFQAWGQHRFGNERHLVLWIPTKEVLVR